MRDKKSGELVVLKFIKRGPGVSAPRPPRPERRAELTPPSLTLPLQIDNNVEREIMNMKMLRHPHIIQFKEILLTPTHLAIVMEYAAGGELFDHIVAAGRFNEAQARYYFQQLITGVDYCHFRNVCHRDLKLENALLDTVPSPNNPPRVKICDFGYSKNDLLHSQPKSTVGTPAYIAPEVLQRKEYSGRQADVWSCGVTLYVMLVGAYPFEDPEDPRNFRKTIQRIMSTSYAIPQDVVISNECRDLLGKIFVADPNLRITIQGIKQHPWFLTALPQELAADDYSNHGYTDLQTEEEIKKILAEAKTVPQSQAAAGAAGDIDGYDDDLDMEDLGSGQFGSGEWGYGGSGQMAE